MTKENAIYHAHPRYRMDIEGPARLNKSGFIPFPQLVEKILTAYPQIRPLVYEMAALDSQTFLHQVMVTECYTLLRTEYIKRIAGSSAPADLASIDNYLRTNDAGVFMHDLGKWLIDPDPFKAGQIINSKPSASTQGDHRNHDERILHKLHPLTGGLAILSLKGIIPGLSDETISQWAQSTFSHHEHFIDLPVANFDGTPIRSYPRKKLRINHPQQEIYFLLLELVDTAVATGQPRVYREDSLVTEEIEFLLENILGNFFDLIGKNMLPEDVVLHKRQFREMIYSTLELVRKKYPADVCRNLKGFTGSSGEPFPPPIYHQGNLMTQLAKNLWTLQIRRLEQTADRLVLIL